MDNGRKWTKMDKAQWTKMDKAQWTKMDKQQWTGSKWTNNNGQDGNAS